MTRETQKGLFIVAFLVLAFLLWRARIKTQTDVVLSSPDFPDTVYVGPGIPVPLPQPVVIPPPDHLPFYGN